MTTERNLRRQSCVFKRKSRGTMSRKDKYSGGGDGLVGKIAGSMRHLMSRLFYTDLNLPEFPV